MDKKLIELLDRCKCGVFITVNEHRDFYQKAQEVLDELDPEDLEEIGGEVCCEMVKRDYIVRIQFYPDTPIGFYTVHHYDINEALNEALSALNEN